MRVVQVLVSETVLEEVTSVLEEESVDYVVTAEDSDRSDAVVVQFPLPPEAVEPVVDRIREVGVGEPEFTLVVSAESVTTEHFAELEARYVEGTDGQEGVAHEEIRATARTMQPAPLPYYALTLLSSVVAVAGLLLDSPAVVVGSMVIAPQVGSALTTSVGAVLDDRALVREGLRSQVLGLGLAVVGAVAFGWLLRSAEFVPSVLQVTTVDQIGQRISPGLLSVTVGLSAGAAGALALATALPVSLVGVMVAAALIPAAATVGIGIAWGNPSVAAGALLLLVVNAVSINLAGIAGLRAFGYRSAADGTDRRRLSSFAVVVLLLCAVLLGAGVVLAEQIRFETDANRAVEDVLDRPQYETLDLVSVRTEFVALPDGPPEVTVAVARPPDRTYPALAATIGDRLTEMTGRETGVTVTFEERQHHDPGATDRISYRDMSFTVGGVTTLR